MKRVRNYQLIMSVLFEKTYVLNLELSGALFPMVSSEIFGKLIEFLNDKRNHIPKVP